MDTPIPEFLAEAANRRVSDIFIIAGRPLAEKIDGHLLDRGDRLMPDQTENLLCTIYGLAENRDISRLMETGADDFSFSIPGVSRFRVNAYKQRGSLAAVIRVIAFRLPDPAELSIPEDVMNISEYTRGMVLVTGSAGSGKSTTLAAIIDKINNNRDAHVITLEDPIEYLHQHKMSMVNQREIGIDSNNYANALRAALREDPDVILVGEMRDFETISVAITAAETGHLVLSTLHTIGAASTVDRVIDVFPPHQQQQIRVQLSNTLEAVISQQLIPTADGKHRVAAFEVMHANHAVRNLIREGKSHQLASVMQTNRKLGMITMDEAIVQLYFEGKIDREQAIQFAQDPDSMENKI
mgnify:CR=1 FL=1